MVWPSVGSRTAKEQNRPLRDSPIETKVQNERAIESVHVSDNLMTMSHLRAQ